MKKLVCLILAVIMIVGIIPISAVATSDTLYKALADGNITKTTASYDGYHFVAGTKAVWDGSLYTLTATATKVNKSYVAFAVTCTSKLSTAYVPADGYEVTVVTNYPDGFNSISGKSGQTINFVVNTAARDPFDYTSAAGGMQFFKIRVEKTFITDTTYSSNPYFADIVNSHEVYPGNSNYFSRVYVRDEHFLGYYVKPAYKINTNAIRVSQTAISLGINSYPLTVNYRIKGAKSWYKKSFAAGKNALLSGLKPNTVYQIQALCTTYYTDPESGVKKAVIDQVCNPFYLTTAINKVPYLAQVKVTNVKYGKQTIKGYWESDGDWHPTETFNTATYTLTLKMRAVPANVKGLVIKVGGATYYLKGRKGTYTTRMTFRAKGSVKGKKVACVLAYSSNTIGYSAVGIGSARSISYKLANSATNYKK